MAKSTISERMRRGQSADEIRRYAALRESRELQRPVPSKVVRVIKTPFVKEVPTQPAEFEAIQRGCADLESLEGWKLRRQKALAERQEIENMLRRGELVPVAYVRTWGVKFITATKDELLRGPSELQDSVAGEADPLKCNTLMRAWVERALAKLASLEELWAAPQNTK